MAPTDLTHVTKNQSRDGEEASEEDNLSQDCKDLILSLPKEKGFSILQISPYLYLFQGFWFSSAFIQTINIIQKHFQAKDSDVVVATIPKSGTTWLKALTFAIINRHRFSSSQNHPLLTSNPHDLVPVFEHTVYGDAHNQVPNLSNMIEPRLFGTHIPFPLLAKSIKESKCRIIYICRNPFDTFVSLWIFLNAINVGPQFALTLEEAFEMYCNGLVDFGPSWNQMLGYWNESIARPHKVLFLKYEDLKQDVNFHVKRVAEFLGCPFTQDEENSGVIENIIKLCSFEKMKELEVNNSGATGTNIWKKHLFRKAEVGDWVNYLSPSMVEKLSKIMEEKLSGSGLSFTMNS
ncbi:cytosolic sulfotransferase 15-like [Gastrolobium bilobum]|uniref:cytosolic sulfotransferase 15-like n=1 Tax=Gastrolobium bilobum TaxID=150636 RepID=UPI002AAF704D|nr:cytosolic sulfotransferase 15-like [Gastrolobium bilobum]